MLMEPGKCNHCGQPLLPFDPALNAAGELVKAKRTIEELRTELGFAQAELLKARAAGGGSDEGQSAPVLLRRAQQLVELARERAEQEPKASFTAFSDLCDVCRGHNLFFKHLPDEEE
jgi:hypothetical protein